MFRVYFVLSESLLSASDSVNVSAYIILVGLEGFEPNIILSMERELTSIFCRLVLQAEPYTMSQ